MKHIFIVNPAAGNGKTLPALLQKITFSSQKLNIDYEIYHTTTVKDATKFVRKKLEENPEETFRFYACGGDGTMNEVANAVACKPNAELAIIPNGTGNDFIRSFTHSENFSDIEKVISGRAVPMDIIKYGENYSLNILNIGLDCDVVKRVDEIKRASWVPHGMAYSIAIAHVLTKVYGTKFTLTTENGEVFDGDHILAVFANARYYGGGYKPAPEAMLNDGLMDVCFFDKIPRTTMLKVLPTYKSGKYVETLDKTPYIHYFKCKKITFESPEFISVCADGELSPAKKFDIEVVPFGIKVVIPSGSKCHALIRKSKENSEEKEETQS